MKTIPSIFDLQNLKSARLTYPFHCCAFKYPKRHNPSRYAEIAEKLQRYCNLHEEANGNPLVSSIPKKDLKRHVYNERTTWSESYNSNYAGNTLEHFRMWNKDDNIPEDNASLFINPLRGETIKHEAAKPVEVDDDFGIFHEKSADVSTSTFRVHAFCGNLSIRTPSVKCFPVPNALNPCEDIMGYSWLRIAVWFVVVFTVLGNLAVITVVLLSGGEITVTRFLICNLAIADLSMGMYLLLIASMDLHSVGTYFNFAYDWQLGLGCKIAGFLTVFASHLSVFTLTVITIERWFAITYAIYLTKRIQIGTAIKMMICGWLYSIIVAALPLFGVSNYSSTSICLPMEINRLVDKAYISFMILMNGVAFGLIVYCYTRIYLSLDQKTRKASTKGEFTIAKKMALLILTDFATFAPIAFFSLTAIAGYPLIGVTRSKILLVFFYPLNSCANPYLYVLMTSQYRADFIQLLAKWGINVDMRRRNTISSNRPIQDLGNKDPHPLLLKEDNKQLKSFKDLENDICV